MTTLTCKPIPDNYYIEVLIDHKWYRQAVAVDLKNPTVFWFYSFTTPEEAAPYMATLMRDFSYQGVRVECAYAAEER